MLTVEDIKRARKNGLRRVLTRKKNRINSIFSIMSIRDIESQIKELALFEEAMETSSNSIQQLQAKIAALIEWYDIPRELAIEQRTVNRAQLLEKLRQLSAV